MSSEKGLYNFVSSIWYALRDNGPSIVENKITQIAIGESCFFFLS